MIWYGFYYLRSGNGVGPILTAPKTTRGALYPETPFWYMTTTQNIYVKFKYQGHWNQVKVTAAKSATVCPGLALTIECLDLQTAFWYAGTTSEHLC